MTKRRGQVTGMHLAAYYLAIANDESKLPRSSAEMNSDLMVVANILTERGIIISEDFQKGSDLSYMAGLRFDGVLKTDFKTVDIPKDISRIVTRDAADAAFKDELSKTSRHAIYQLLKEVLSKYTNNN